MRIAKPQNLFWPIDRKEQKEYHFYQAMTKGKSGFKNRTARSTLRSNDRITIGDVWLQFVKMAVRGKP
jgi:hypothetical protein